MSEPGFDWQQQYEQLRGWVAFLLMDTRVREKRHDLAHMWEAVAYERGRAQALGEIYGLMERVMQATAPSPPARWLLDEAEEDAVQVDSI